MNDSMYEQCKMVEWRVYFHEFPRQAEWSLLCIVAYHRPKSPKWKWTVEVRQDDRPRASAVRDFQQTAEMLAYVAKWIASKGKVPK